MLPVEEEIPVALDQPAGTLEGLRRSFPFTEIRTAQALGLQVMANSRDQAKKFTVLECPTGSGKSGLGMAAAIHSASAKDGGAHYLTSQNSLSTQLTRDFSSSGLVEVRGARNYRCLQVADQDCKSGAGIKGGFCSGCPYRAAKNAYMSTKLGVTNYTYFLTETMHAQELGPRKDMIADEGHNIEREILALVSATITQHKANDVKAGRVPVFYDGEDAKVRRWLSEEYIPAAKKYLGFLAVEVDQLRNGGQRVPSDLQNKIDELKQMLETISLYMESSSSGDWLAWTDNNGALCLRPLSAADFAQQYLFYGTPNVLIMSATILDFDTFRRNLGIRKSESNVLAVPSDFPLQNRRIIYWPVGSMGSKNIEQALPRLAERTDAVLTAPKFAKTKGIIHTHSYRINTFLNNALQSRGVNGSRIITHSALPGSREEAIDRHFASSDPTILMSPSMTEGLDLKDDLSRLQIISKVPYPFLDPYNKTRMQRDPKWYQLQTALALVQATGRSVRSADDYATTLILDADFGRFLSQNQDILPKWWLDSIEFK